MIEKEPDLDLQPKQQATLESGHNVSQEFYDADALKRLEKEKKHFERFYYPGFVRDSLLGPTQSTPHHGKP